MDKIKHLLIHFLQKNSSNEELEEMEHWLKETANRRMLSSYQKLWVWSGQLKPRRPQIEFEIIWNKIENQRTFHIPRHIWKYAAVLLLCLNIGWGAIYLFQQKNQSTLSQSIEIAAGQSANSIITLPDQSLVYLHPGSRLEYDFGSGNDSRDVFLDGEAYFEVEKDVKRPFTVHTSKADIRVLGTKFNVFDARESEIAQTTLVEGKVEFTTNYGKSYILKPSQMIELNTETKTVQLNQVNTELYTAWKDGKIIFRNESLGNIARKLERTYHVKFIFENPDLASAYEFSGTFHRETSIGEVLQMLQISIPMDVKRTERFPEPDLIYLK